MHIYLSGNNNTTQCVPTKLKHQLQRSKTYSLIDSINTKYINKFLSNARWYKYLINKSPRFLDKKKQMSSCVNVQLKHYRKRIVLMKQSFLYLVVSTHQEKLVFPLSIPLTNTQLMIFQLNFLNSLNLSLPDLCT